MENVFRCCCCKKHRIRNINIIFIILFKIIYLIKWHIFLEKSTYGYWGQYKSYIFFYYNIRNIEEKKIDPDKKIYIFKFTLKFANLKNYETYLFYHWL